VGVFSQFIANPKEKFTVRRSSLLVAVTLLAVVARSNNMVPSAIAAAIRPLRVLD
jgi:hypothetical protein